MTRAFVILNPVAGTTDGAEVRSRIRDYLDGRGWEYEIHETEKGEDVSALVSRTVDEACDLLVACGGDGTVSAVAGGLVGSDVPLGIVPLGSGNILAQDLHIPQDLDDALALLDSEHRIQTLDVMAIENRYYVLNAGVGVSSLMMRDTERENKQRFGGLAYLWTGLQKLMGLQPRSFYVELDGEGRFVRAADVLVNNSGVVGNPAWRWQPDIRVDDGKLAVCVIRARSILDYVRIGWSMIILRERRQPHVDCRNAEKRVLIETRDPLPLQADGDVIGETPVEIHLVPGAVRVIVPPELDETDGVAGE